MRFLLVEDEDKLSRSIAQGLGEAGYTVDIAGDAQHALALVRSQVYDLFILDIMLPGMDGIALCQRLRSTDIMTPILMLSARGGVSDRVRGLDSGADDYLTKPFSMAELTARIRSLLRRQRPERLLVLTVSDLVLDVVTRTVKRGTRVIDLTAREFALLRYLMQHAGETCTRAMIAEQVWDFGWERLTNVIDVHVNHLRHKLEEGSEPRLLHSVRGMGYVIRDPNAVD